MKSNKIAKKYVEIYSIINMVFMSIFWITFIMCKNTPQKHVSAIILIFWITALVMFGISEIILTVYKKKCFKLIEEEILSKKDSLTKEDFDYFEMTKFFHPIQKFAKTTAIDLGAVANPMFANIWYSQIAKNSYTVEIDLYCKSKNFLLSINADGAVSFVKK